jgi:NAD dependent epimerase/dehydratase
MGSSVLVTGAGGFIGSHLAEACVRRGDRVRGLVHYNSRQSFGWLDRSPQLRDIEVVLGDVRDFDSVLRHSKGVDRVFHLAALIGIPYSYESPRAYIDTNVVGTYNVLEAARLHGIGEVLVTSTSEVYGTAQRVPIDESHPCVGQSPYAASKIGADQIAVSYQRSFGLPVKIVRPFNAYGPRQSPRAIVPTIITQILSGKPEIQLGSLHPTRDLTFVEDTAEGFLRVAATASLVGRAVNIGTGVEISIGDLARKITALLQVDARPVQDPRRVRPQSSEVERLVCDSSLLEARTGWRPGTKLEEGLEATIEWFRAHAGLFAADRYHV